MKNAAFYGEEGPGAFDPVVSDILAALGKHSLPYWYIRAALETTIGFYDVGEVLEAKFPAERFMPVNGGRN